MRSVEDMDPKKPYCVHVKTQAIGKLMVAGDMSTFKAMT